MKKCALFLLALFVSDAWAAGHGGICKDFQFEKIKSVSLTDVGRLADTKTSSGPTGTIVFWFFDEEDRPVKHGMRAVGLVIARGGDIGDIAQGGFLWTTLPTSKVSVQDSVANGKVMVTAKRNDGSKACERSAITFTFSDVGLTVQ